MNNNILNKALVMGIIVLFIGAGVASSSTILSMSKTQIFSYSGNILYVGGNGEGNYTDIQDAIDDASDGDTVFVFDDSSPYQLTTFLTINKSINLIGENRDTTVISGSINLINGSADTAILITIAETDWVNISGFTIKNSNFYGIAVILSDNINVSGNIFIDNGFISLVFSVCNYSYISNNIFTSTKVDDLLKEGGIYLEYVSFTTIIGNIFTNCLTGIALRQFFGDVQNPNSNIIDGNLFDNNMVAMEIRADNTIINKNTILNHTGPTNLIIPALSLKGRKNTVTCNNFINNIRDAMSVQYLFSLQDFLKIGENKNVWDGNYWGEPRSQPKFIRSRLRYEREPPNPAIPIPWFNFDMNPAQEPYDITTGQGFGIE